MKFYYPIFGLFLIFVLWQAYERKKSDRKNREASDSFWQKESDANSVRKQPLDNEHYITIPENLLINNLWKNHPEDDTLLSLSDTLASLMDKRILNLTGMTSTDIKLKYGVANLNEVTTYDDNFTLMAKTIAEYGQKLMELENTNAAILVFQFGIDSLTDISSNYKYLAQLYKANGQPEKIDSLIDTASKLDSLMKNSIIKTLNEIKEN